MLKAVFFLNHTATTEIYTLSLHDALPIYRRRSYRRNAAADDFLRAPVTGDRSEEHTSELQSPMYLVCRLLLEKKKLHTSFFRCMIDLELHDCIDYVQAIILISSDKIMLHH